jgi:hypothetical protein
MPIQGLTTKAASFVELGTIRKGGAKTDPKRPGPDLDYFRFVTADREAADAFKEAFTDKPRSIEFVLPFESLEENYEAWREAYVASGLAHRCDGVTCVQWRDDKGKMQFGEKPCPTPSEAERKAGGCKQVGRLKIIIPALKRFAYITVTTTSIYDIMTMYQNLLAIQMVSGTLRGVPMILRRTEKEISTPAEGGNRARRKKWLLSIEPHPQWVEKKLLEQRNEAFGLIEATKSPLMIESGAVIEDDDENDEIHEGEVVHAESTAVEETPFDFAAARLAFKKGVDLLKTQFKIKPLDIDDRLVKVLQGEVPEVDKMEAEELSLCIAELRAWYGELNTKEKK